MEFNASFSFCVGAVGLLIGIVVVGVVVSFILTIKGEFLEIAGLCKKD